MRGFGSIFGSDQSGACDVGLDLQANILETAAKKLNSECILSIPDCRISIGCQLEIFGVKEIGELPLSTDLSGVSRWEASLAEKIITEHSPKKGRNKAYVEEEVLRNYLAAGTSDACRILRETWTKQLKEVSTVENCILNCTCFVSFCFVLFCF